MAHPLDGARLKVVRAQEHIQSLCAELRAYLDSDPYRVVANKQGDWWRTNPEVRLEPPLRLATIIGDCLANARAALDYIAWELSVRHLQAPAFNAVDDKRWVSFPLTIDPLDPGYVNKINRFTNRKLPADAIAEIEAVQPHNSGYESLWWLHELVNTDKHRMPLLAIGVADPINTVISFTNGMTGWFTDTSNTDPGIQRLTIEHLAPGTAKVRMDGQLTGFVAFQDVAMPRVPVDLTLQQIVETVANVIPRFDPFFV